MRLFLKFILVSFFAAHAVIADTPHFFTDVELAEKWKGIVHPGEKPRGDAFLESTRKGGFNIGCAAALSAYANNRLGKVFHNGMIGATFAEFTLDTDRPKEVRFGSFSDEVPQTLWGLASYTTGRDEFAPNQLFPDVTGKGLVLIQGDKLVSWTTTASRAAFARSGERFSRLAGYPALVKMLFGLMSPSELRAAHQGRTQNSDQPDNRYRNPPGFFHRLALFAGKMVGEGLFVGLDPVPGFGTLVPAVLSGRRSPFPGYREVGFGTDTRLLTDTVPLKERRAFRLSFALADNDTNAQLLKEIPGWLTTVTNGIRGQQQLSAEFAKWMSKKGMQIKYDVFMQLDDPKQSELSPIEESHLGWYTTKIRVGTLTLHGYGATPGMGSTLNDFAIGMHLPPGAGFHMPVGDLAWYRSVGRIIGRQAGPITIKDTAPGGLTAVGAYTQSRDLRLGPNTEEEIAKLKALFQMAGIDPK